MRLANDKAEGALCEVDVFEASRPGPYGYNGWSGFHKACHTGLQPQRRRTPSGRPPASQTPLHSLLLYSHVWASPWTGPRPPAAAVAADGARGQRQEGRGRRQGLRAHGAGPRGGGKAARRGRARRLLLVRQGGQGLGGAAP